ncbi:MAG: F0F1 ATP synthase subunit A [Verrucomicrobia bacterium]|nr:F0F1 ATP synthase subunit A [Verrucomicrobiota bacterium]
MLLNLIIASSLTLNAPNFSESELGVGYFEWLTNSILATFIVVAAIVFWARQATRNMQIVPGPTQNLFEAVVEFLYDMLEGIVGKHMVGRVFSLLASLFIFILIANWFGLLPGVGSIGWGHPDHSGHGFDITVPLLRPTTADLNMTLGMATVFMFFWIYWTLSEVGVKNFLAHIFGVKGGLKGIAALLLAPIFFFVGIIEVISILFRPVSLSLRLYGNVFAGENLLSSMINLGRDLGLPDWLSAGMSVLVPIPFYFLELLVGVLQALVFTLLCAVYIQLSTTHDEEEEH